MHLVPDGQVGWIPYAERLYEWSEKLVLEMRVSRSLDVLKLKSPHSNVLPDDVHSALRQRWVPEVFGNISDMNLPGLYLLGGSLNLGAVHGVEAVMSGWVQDEELIGELETPAEFVGAFNVIPDQVFIESLRWRLRNDVVARKNFAGTYRAWRGQSAEKMLKILRSELPEQVRAAMFDQRNEQWAPCVAEWARTSKRTLICVGAGHLHGRLSLLELLEQKYGLKCSRIQA